MTLRRTLLAAALAAGAFVPVVPAQASCHYCILLADCRPLCGPLNDAFKAYDSVAPGGAVDLHRLCDTADGRASLVLHCHD